jgi:hypothetical protein
MNSWKLGDSDGERRRIDMGWGRRAVVSFRRCRRGLKDRDGIECDRVGDRFVGGSYLQSAKVSARVAISDGRSKSLPDTHDKHFEALDRYTVVSEDIRESKHPPSITCSTLREDNNRSICCLSNFFKGAWRHIRIIWWYATGCGKN